jgi:HK97 gp10 family phage protein
MMADDLQFSLIGLAELEAKLKEVSDDVRYKGGRFALRKAAEVIRDKAKAGAERVDDPKSPERIADNIVTRFSRRRFQRTSDLMFRVGVMGTANPRNAEKTTGLPGGATQHWRMLEFGTERMPAQPFMRSALADNISEAIGEFMTQYDKALARAIRRASRGSS